MLKIHYLAWTLKIVRGERKIDCSFITHVETIGILGKDNGTIAFLYRAVEELLLDMLVCRLVFGGNNKSAGIHIKSMTQKDVWISLLKE